MAITTTNRWGVRFIVDGEGNTTLVNPTHVVSARSCQFGVVSATELLLVGNQKVVVLHPLDRVWAILAKWADHDAA